LRSGQQIAVLRAQEEPASAFRGNLASTSASSASPRHVDGYVIEGHVPAATIKFAMKTERFLIIQDENRAAGLSQGLPNLRDLHRFRLC
jgi:hypothetical protein